MPNPEVFQATINWQYQRMWLLYQLCHIWPLETKIVRYHPLTVWGQSPLSCPLHALSTVTGNQNPMHDTIVTKSWVKLKSFWWEDRDTIASCIGLRLPVPIWTTRQKVCTLCISTKNYVETPQWNDTQRWGTHASPWWSRRGSCSFVHHRTTHLESGRWRMPVCVHNLWEHACVLLTVA